MSTRKVIIEMTHSANLQRSADLTAAGSEKKLPASTITASPLFTPDSEFGVVELNAVVEGDVEVSEAGRAESDGRFTVDVEHKHSTYIVRGEVEEKDLKSLETQLKQEANFVGIYADVEIEPQLVCPGSAAVGTDTTVETLLCVSKMKAKGLNGKGVYVAIVDTGINMAYLNAQGKFPGFSATWSWKPATSTVTPGSAPVGHGTMCAFDVCIAAPNCTLLDIALLTTRATGPTAISGLLSDAIKAYQHLIKFMGRAKRPGENASLVVNNSWGMFHPSWDYPVGHSGNYSHNPNHPFNLIVRRLALLGADILFAAGNCGPECPDGRCQGVTNAGIYGANSSPYVTSVAGVATNLDRVGYSNRGPGNLTRKKPDITGYTHFSGSGVYSADGGTSAACPVVAGVVAAVRTKRPYNPSSTTTHPPAIRNLLTSTARDLGASGYDYFYGYGVVNGCKIVDKMFPRPSICVLYPRICEILRRDKIKFVDLCSKYPHLCRNIKIDDFEIPGNVASGDYDGSTEVNNNQDDLLELLEIYLGGNPENTILRDAAPIATKKDDDCGCKK